MDITQRKAERYNWLLSQHDFLTEKIRQIKANNLEQTPQEEQHYKTKFNTVFSLFFEGIPNRENVLRYLEDTTTVRFRNPYNKMKYHKRGFNFHLA